MRKVIMVTTALMMAAAQAQGNPLPPYEIVHVRAFPPEMGLSLWEPTDLSGDTILTSSGLAIVDSGVIGEGNRFNPFVLDSSNTSGFIINSERDSVSMTLDFLEPVSWGTWGENAPPIMGYHVERDTYYFGQWDFVYVFCFDFANPDQGRTQVVINEVNSHGTWGQGSGFIELYNFGDTAISLNGWKIVCDTILDLPDDASIKPHKFYVVDNANFPGSFDMDFSSDNIYLIDADSDVVDQVGWSSDHGADVSFMRFPDGDTSALYWWDAFWGFDDESSINFSNGFPSRRAANRYDSPGLKVMGIAADVSPIEVTIYWTNPIWLSIFEQAVVRRSVDGFPQTPFDGELIYEGTDQEYCDRNIIPNQTLYYTVFARTSCGEYSVPDSESQICVVVPSVGIDGEPLPESAFYMKAYPNPFNATTVIKYRVPEPGIMSLSIYSITGQKLATIFEGYRESGEYEATWSVFNISSGVYFARVKTDQAEKSVKMLFLK